MVFSFMPYEFGYMGIPKSQANNTYTTDNWYTVSDINGVTNVDGVFKSIKPAFKLTGNRLTDIYIMDDTLPKKTSQQGAGLFYSFTNTNGLSLLNGFINKLKTNFKFHADENSDGTYEMDLEMKLVNTVVNGVSYKNRQGGHVKVKFYLDENEASNTYGDIVTLNN
jgi:hypothetical protein